jgi:endoglucanase
MQRRDFLTSAFAAAVSGPASFLAGDEPRGKNDRLNQPLKLSPQDRLALIDDRRPPLAQRLPRWRGFNLLEKFNAGSNRPFAEDDFRWISGWGFDFVRLPMDYRCWTDPGDPYKLRENTLGEIDQAVEFGKRYGIHVSLNLHRAPGYTVAQPPEKLDLWTSEEAQKQFDFQWSHFARRYKGIPSSQLSFNLVNEPARIPVEKYAKVVRRATAAIRREEPGRLVIADGLSWGNDPVESLADLRIAQATRGYFPMPISHYQASWVHGERFPRPTWPLVENKRTIDRAVLRKERIEPWKKLESRGVGVIVGEWGAFNRTPHDVVLNWARDCLELWKEAGWGWALWNFRGGFGILDSGRDDVAYADHDGHKLDRRLLDLLQRY